MKTQDNKLRFNRTSLVNLNDDDLSNIKGGSWDVLVDYINDKLRTITGGREE